MAADINSLVITRHAKEQYLRRSQNFKQKRSIVDPEEDIKWMMSKAAEVKIDDFQEVVRFVKNGYQPARYFQYKGWRFVVVNGVVKTVERVNWRQN
jgi:hypothetical protein